MLRFGDFVSGSITWLLLTVIVALSTADDQPQLVGSRQPIIGLLGHDVILRCHLEPKFNVHGLTVEWTKTDLKPHYVHLYRDRHEVPDMKIPSYVGRTELFADGLKDGNVELKITNVTLDDQGRYRCFVPKLKSPVKECVLQLVVEPNTVATDTPLHPGNLPTPDPNETDVKGFQLPWSSLIPVLVVLVVLVLVILVAGVAGYLLRHRCLKNKGDPDYEAAPTSPDLGLY